ncbi:MAG: extracellular solute-binding protein [Pseudomonadota bacterium]
MNLCILRLLRGASLAAALAALLSGLAAAAEEAAPIRAASGGAAPAAAAPSAGAPWRHAIAMHGAPALGPGFAHFPYADPSAPMGGRLRRGARGTFDTLNPFLARGQAPFPVRSLVYESLMARSWDEPFSLYGLLAESIASPPDRSFVAFRLREAARFADGSPVTIDDVIWSMETLRDLGRPNFGIYYNQIARVERLGPRAVKFHFEAPDRELPLLIGLMPILPKADFEGRDFQEASFRPPLGSGPYRVASVDPGRSVRFDRDPSYWGRDLPVNAGRHRLDVIDQLYFRDGDTMWEAFKAEGLDLFIDTDPVRWRDGYDFPAAREERILRREAKLRRPSGMEGFVFNTRRPLFQDRRVREALALAFDYDWANATYFAGRMTRITSYFSGSPLGFEGAATREERALLAPFASALPERALESGWRPPATAAPGAHREALVTARALLAKAGWRVRDFSLRDAEGRPFSFEILIDRRAHERLARAFAENLEWLGIAASVRLVDKTQRTERLLTFDYDMIVARWGFSLSPGQEQRFYFGSESRESEGARNYMGVADPAVDAMIDAMLAAEDRAAFETAVRAYDRVLSSGVYVIPWGWRSVDWIAHDAGLRFPERTAAYGFVDDVLWRVPE